MQEPFYAKAELVRIRYNTNSDGVFNTWRIILGEKEMLVNSIEIRKFSCTSCDWMESEKALKHHITVENCLVEIDTKNNAVIS